MDNQGFLLFGIKELVVSDVKMGSVRERIVQTFQVSFIFQDQALLLC